MKKIITYSRGLFRKAVEVAVQAHAGQVDGLGVPKICHCIAVTNGVSGEYAKCVAMLHDTVEDTELTLDDLRGFGFPERIVKAVGILTHDKKTPYLDYVQRIWDSGDLLARIVKRADLLDNTDPYRCEKSPVSEEKQELYKQAKQIMKI